MKAILSARSRSYGGAPPPVLYALLVLVSIGASATAQSGGAPVERLDSIAGVREDRSVGLTAAVVKGKDTLLLKAYGKSYVEGAVPMTVDTIVPIGSDTKQFTAAAVRRDDLAVDAERRDAAAVLDGTLRGRGQSRSEVHRT